MIVIRLMVNFWKGICQLPLFWQAWVHFIIFANIGGAVLFWNQTLSGYILLCYLLSFLLGLGLLYLQGFTKLLGLMHAPLVYIVYSGYPLLESQAINTPFGLWLRLILLINCVILVIDALDVLRYVLGNRKNLLS